MNYFTRGPWHIEIDGRSVSDLNGFRVAESFCGIPATQTVSPGDLRRAKANARLIAAAPTLLAALRMAYELMPFHESGCPREDEISPTNTLGEDRLERGCDCVLHVMRDAIEAALGTLPADARAL